MIFFSQKQPKDLSFEFLYFIGPIYLYNFNVYIEN